MDILFSNNTVYEFILAENNKQTKTTNKELMFEGNIKSNLENYSK